MHPILMQLKQKVDESTFAGYGREVIRVQLKELLQDYLLHAIYAHDEYRRLIFIGGTALRKTQHLPRMSEDLDFASPSELNLPAFGNYLVEYFKKIRFEKVDYTAQQSAHVCRLTMKFAILADLGLSPLASEKLFVKIEFTVSTHQYPTELTLYTGSSLLIPLRHYPLETMMAGKILACLDRVWKKTLTGSGSTDVAVKGRDYFDLLWYMEKGIQPNERVLQDAHPEYTKERVWALLDEKVHSITPHDLLVDLQPYIEDQHAVAAWCDNFLQLYQKNRVKY